MREILFKAFERDDAGTGEAVEVIGHYTAFPGPSCITVSEPHDIYDIGTIVEIDESTLRQYTGLQDNEKRRLFDGDTLRIYHKDYGVFEVPVLWLDGCFVLDNYKARQVSLPEGWAFPHPPVDTDEFLEDKYEPLCRMWGWDKYKMWEVV